MGELIKKGREGNARGIRREFFIQVQGLFMNFARQLDKLPGRRSSVTRKLSKLDVSDPRALLPANFGQTSKRIPK